MGMLRRLRVDGVCLGRAVVFVGGEHLIADPLLPALEELCARPTWVRFLPPAHVNDSEGHFPAFDFEEHVISVDPSSDCSRFQSVQNVLWRHVGCQPSRKMLNPILDFRRIFNDPPRSQHLDIVRN
jgi:hypothetical protein